MPIKKIAALAFTLGLSAGAIAQAPDIATLSAPIVGNQGQAIGKADFQGGAHGTVLRIAVQPGGLTPGWHGIHFHAVGDCADTAKFEASKSHVNHAQKKHGLLNPDGPDEGDLPNVYAAADGSVNAEVSSPTLLKGAKGLQDADGSALIIHANADDHHTQPIGGAGSRVGCAVIK
jgi:Cu-Zn family superoxide dismutase